jgi:putative FmdB family regulatory protein
MPIFEYLCDDCGTKFEKLVRNGASNDVLCPSCGQSHVTTQLSTFAAHAHGSSRGSSHGSSQETLPSCASGMCQTPGLCGRN